MTNQLIRIVPHLWIVDMAKEAISSIALLVDAGNGLPAE